MTPEEGKREQNTTSFTAGITLQLEVLLESSCEAGAQLRDASFSTKDRADHSVRQFDKLLHENSADGHADKLMKALSAAQLTEILATYENNLVPQMLVDALGRQETPNLDLLVVLRDKALPMVAFSAVCALFGKLSEVEMARHVNSLLLRPNLSVDDVAHVLKIFDVLDPYPALLARPALAQIEQSDNKENSRKARAIIGKAQLALLNETQQASRKAQQGLPMTDREELLVESVSSMVEDFIANARVNVPNSHKTPPERK